ncbi:X-box-binding protein 1 [Umbelopsis nana]
MTGEDDSYTAYHDNVENEDHENDSSLKRPANDELDANKTKARRTSSSDSKEKGEEDKEKELKAEAVAAEQESRQDHDDQDEQGDEVSPLHNPLPMLTAEQQQQLLQTYAQASGQDLAHLTASSLAQAMVSPIAVPGLTTSLLQSLQGGSVITSLPGPPHLTGNMRQDGTGEEDVDKRSSGTRNLTNDERRQRRLFRNRVAAKECRKKKKASIQNMEERIQQLEEENERLQKELEDVNAKLALGAMQGSDSYRLMKEVEELNAKLGLSQMANAGHALTAAVVAAAASAHHHQQQGGESSAEQQKFAQQLQQQLAERSNATETEKSKIESQ